MNIIAVRHNIEVAHRLSLLPGRCENIHGHSMWVTLEILNLPFDDRGILGSLDFGRVKKDFREHLDSEYDHRLLLNSNDPLIGMAKTFETVNMYPGLQATAGDPTTENIASWIRNWAVNVFYEYPEFEGELPQIKVTVWETAVNCAVVGA